MVVHIPIKINISKVKHYTFYFSTIMLWKFIFPLCATWQKLRWYNSKLSSDFAVTLWIISINGESTIFEYINRRKGGKVHLGEKRKLCREIPKGEKKETMQLTLSIFILNQLKNWKKKKNRHTTTKKPKMLLNFEKKERKEGRCLHYP